jgi:hypothetical protein
MDVGHSPTSCAVQRNCVYLPTPKVIPPATQPPSDLVTYFRGMR